MSGVTEKQSRKLEVFVSSLISSPTIQEAAKTAGISTATARRWQQLPEFREQYDAAKRALVSRAITDLQNSASRAVQVLVDVAEDPESPASSRVSAARAVLDHAMKGTELEDFETRLQAIENTLERITDGGDGQ